MNFPLQLAKKNLELLILLEQSHLCILYCFQPNQVQKIVNIFIDFQLISNFYNKNKQMNKMSVEQHEHQIKTEIFQTNLQNIERISMQDDGKSQWQFPEPVINSHNSFDYWICFDQPNNRNSFNKRIEDDIDLLLDGKEELLVENYSSKSQQIEEEPVDKNKKQFFQEVVGKVGQAKNIPKNFTKQIIKFVNRNPSIIEEILISLKSKLNYNQLNDKLQSKKKYVRKIADLRNMWIKQTQFSKQMRVISNFFLRRQGLDWIYNSRIKNSRCHLKFRRLFINQIRQPDNFISLHSLEMNL